MLTALLVVYLVGYLLAWYLVYSAGPGIGKSALLATLWLFWRIAAQLNAGNPTEGGRVLGPALALSGVCIFSGGPLAGLVPWIGALPPETRIG